MGSRGSWKAGLVMCAAAAATLMGAPAPSVASDKMSLEESNQRWRGARCRSRVAITLNKRKPKDGWARSHWWIRAGGGGNERVRVWLTEWDAIRARYLGGTLPVGSEFVAVGWGTVKSKDRGDLFLELEHVELGARARVFYGKDWAGIVGVGSLDEFEQWARLEMFEITETPSEQLVEVEMPTTAPPPARPTAVVAPPGPVLSAEPTELRVLAASVEPARALPGDELNLQVIYQIDGLAAGAAVNIDEQRVVLRDGATLTTLRAAARHGAGIHHSSQSLRLPPNLAPGLYELQVRVSAAGLEAAGSAVFQVEPAGGR